MEGGDLGILFSGMVCPVRADSDLFIFVLVNCLFSGGVGIN